MIYTPLMQSPWSLFLTSFPVLIESEYAIPELRPNGFLRRYKEKWEGLPQRGTQIEYGKVGGKTYENCRREHNREYEWARAAISTLSTPRGRSDRWRRRWNDGKAFSRHRGYRSGCDIHEKFKVSNPSTSLLETWNIRSKTIRVLKLYINCAAGNSFYIF